MLDAFKFAMKMLIIGTNAVCSMNKNCFRIEYELVTAIAEIITGQAITFWLAEHRSSKKFITCLIKTSKNATCSAVSLIERIVRCSE